MNSPSPPRRENLWRAGEPARIPEANQLIQRILAIGLLAWLVPRVDAQSQETIDRRSATVHVIVVDADGSRLPEVNLAISRRDVGAVLSGRTGASGSHVFRAEWSTGTYLVMARRPGFAPAQAQIEFRGSDTILVTLRLQRNPVTQLPNVEVEESRSNYLLSGSQIAASGRPIRDAFEALRKLRPSMLHDGDRCRHEVVSNVWINGRRVLFMATQVPVFGARSVRTVGGARVSTARGEPPAVDSVLASIRAEHIDEIRLVNCWDTSMPGVGSNNALYVVLKAGIDWDWRRGSFIADSMQKH